MFKKVLLAALASLLVSPTLLALDFDSKGKGIVCPAVCYHPDSTIFVIFKFKEGSKEEEVKNFLSKLSQPLQGGSKAGFDNIKDLGDGRYSADYHSSGCYNCHSIFAAAHRIQSLGMDLVKLEKVDLRKGSILTVR